MEFNATFIASVISFIVFTIVMNAIFYKPLDKIVQERQKFIDETNEEAKTKLKKSEAILKDKAKKIEKTKHDAKKVIVEKTDDAKSQKNAITTEAQQKASSTIDTAKADLQRSKEDAQGILTNNVVDLAQSISAKILGEDIAINNVDSEKIQKIMNEG